MTFPTDLNERNEYILQAVKDGKAQVNWVPLVSEIPGYNAIFYVTSDALKIDNVRINVSAYLQQQIADLLGASLLTPKLSDLRFVQAKIRLEPKPRPITSSTEAMIDQSAKLDKLLTNPGYSSDKNAIVATVGKDWVITEELIIAPKNHGINYGWHFAGSIKFQGTQGYPCDSLEKDPISGMIIHTIQPSAGSHDFSHVDYSQNCVLVKQFCLINNQEMKLSDLLQNKDLAPLASHTGKMSIVRQLGPQILPPLKTDLSKPIEVGAVSKKQDDIHELIKDVPVYLDPEHPSKAGLSHVKAFNWQNLFDLFKKFFK